MREELLKWLKSERIAHRVETDGRVLVKVLDLKPGEKFDPYKRQVLRLVELDATDLTIDQVKEYQVHPQF